MVACGHLGGTGHEHERGAGNEIAAMGPLATGPSIEQMPQRAGIIEIHRDDANAAPQRGRQLAARISRYPRQPFLYTLYFSLRVAWILPHDNHAT